MGVPRATMRLQMHSGFTFADAAGIAPYLTALGISHVYSSPILTARAGSMHGYDVTDPSRVNPELGGEAGLRRLVGVLRAEGMGMIVDIVPNHMAVGQGNPWWQAMLREGPNGRYGAFFDIDWYPANPLLHGKVLLPVLGKPYGEALEAGELRLTCDGAGFAVAYFDQRFPVRPEDEAEVHRHGPENFAKPALHELLERQHYRLAFWRTAADEINWRRFFDVNELVSLRAERREVFEASHEVIFRLYAEGLIDGVRVDHVDGLSDPRAYCRSLRARLAELDPRRPPSAPPGPAWIIVEKILGAEEALPEDWQVDGTSGYDFMELVSAVQHDRTAASALAELWASVSGRSAEYRAEEVAARREILDRSFTAQLESVVDALHFVALHDLRTRDQSRPAIRRALVALLANFPVYRAYATGAVRPVGDGAAFVRALARAEACPRLARADILRQLVCWLQSPATVLQRVAAVRFQQLTAPLAAKASEDTALYRYGRLLSRNDVGFDPAQLGIDIAVFHEANARRVPHFPASQLATATHDHKRGEDTRARLAVLSAIPAEWARTLRKWMAQNARRRGVVGGRLVPSAGDEAILYQTLIGTWPFGGVLEGYAERIAGWQQKALREAKLFTSWADPNLEYEQAARRFLDGALGDVAFRAELSAFVERIAPAAAVNGLAQVTLKLTVPGVPDFFQGTDFWDQTLVDPDNRRPVDFAARITALEADAAPAELAGCWRDGRVKQGVIRRLLRLRSARPEVFERGDYVPLSVEGVLREHLIAFARRWREAAILVIVPRCAYRLLARGGLLFADTVWRDTRVRMPTELAGRTYRSVLTDSSATCGPELRVGSALEAFPVAVLSG